MADHALGIGETSSTLLDGATEPTAGQGAAPGKPGKRVGGEKTKPGPLLKKYEGNPDAEREIARIALNMWESVKEVMSRPRAQWRVNAARRLGVSNAKIRYDVDTHWTAWFPHNASPDTIPDVNKAAADCRRMTALVWADAYVPEVVAPTGEDDQDEAAVELSQRALLDLQSQNHLNSSAKGREAFDRSHTFGSGYERFWVDARGGGKRPVQIQARADAIHADLALVDPLTGAQGEQVDPATGEKLPFQTRYVKQDGSLTDDPDDDDIAIEWLPKLRSEILDGRHVQLLPHTASDISTAYGAQVASMVSWGTLKQMAPDIVKLPADVQTQIKAYRPTFADDIIPGGKRNDVGRTKKGGEDETLCFVLTTYYRMGAPGYDNGLYLLTVGDQYVLHRSDWIDPDAKTPQTKELLIPISQYAGFGEGRDGYWKVGLMEILGGGNELRAAQVAGALDHLDKLNNRKIFLPTNSLIKPQDLTLPRATVLPINPGGQPVYEDVPPWSNDSYNLYELTGRAMDEASGLQEASGGTNKANVKSGRQAFAIISQVHAGLSEIRQNVESGFTRSSQIALQLARAFFTTEQELEWAPGQSKFRHTAWSGADLVSEADIRIMAGTGTMLAPAAKAQLAEKLYALGLLDQEELREIISSGVGGMVGMQDNPHRLRIRNQLAEWADGPPDGWQPPPMGTVTAPQMGLGGMPAPPQIIDPVLAQLFEPTPADTYPPVAQIRLSEIVKFMATTKYLAQPPQWRLALDTEYAKMGQALVPLPQPQSPEGEPIGGEDPEQKALNDLGEDALSEGAPPELAQA